MPAVQPYLLTVLAGPNAGAQAPLGGAQVSVGGEGCDVVLDGWTGAPMTLAMRGERVRVRPGDAPLTLGAHASGEPIEPGATRVAALPITVGAVDEAGRPLQLHLCRATPARRGAGLRRAILGSAVAATVIGAVVAATDAGLLSMEALAGPAAARVEAERGGQVLPERVALAEPSPVEAQATPAEADAAPIAVAAVEVDTPERAAEALAAAAAEAGLVGLEIEARGEVVRVGGRRAPEQAADWSRVRQAFDGRWSGRVPLIVDVEEVATAAPIAVASAWLGDAPEVTTRDGAVFGLGDEVPGGWRIEEIRAGAVALARGRQNVVIEF